MSVIPSFRTYIRVAVVSAAAACVILIAPQPAEASYSCPTGWQSRTTAQIGNVIVFCYKTNSGGGTFYGDDVHVVKAVAQNVGQNVRHPSNPNDLYGYTGTSQDPNPAFLKKSVRDHLFDYKASGVDILINGTFFEKTEGYDNSELAFPTWQNNQLRNTGANASANRRCFAWGVTQVPKRFAWTNASTQWSQVVNASNDCSSSTPYHRFVGLAPLVGSGSEPRTYIGRDNSGPTKYICFLVGGVLTNQEAVDTLNSFGCSQVVQLDGGNSSQLSYVDPVSGQVISPVDGQYPIYHRGVPHYFVISG